MANYSVKLFNKILEINRGKGIRDIQYLDRFISANNIVSFNFKNLILNNRNFSNNLVVAIA